jgi:hypothetical protein
MRVLVVLVAFAVAAGSAVAGPPKLTGMFSNMRFGTEDVDGVEVFVTYSKAGYFAHVQCAEGAPGVPFLVPATVTNSVLKFDVPAGSEYRCPSGPFKGQVSAQGLRGSFGTTNWPGFLARRRSYWQ